MNYPQGKPVGYNESFSDWNNPNADHKPPSLGTDAQLPAKDVKDPVDNGGSIPMTKFKADKSPDAVMSFKSSSSDPKAMPLPHGRGYGEFNQANDSRPRSRFQDKVDVRKILKGNTNTAQDTGETHG